MVEYTQIDTRITIKKSIVNAINYSNNLHFVAVGRENGSVEIYDQQQQFFLLSKIIISNTDSIDELKFMTFNGESKLIGITSKKLFEIELNRMCIKQDIHFIQSHCARSLIQVDNKIIVGCESGFINIYEYVSEITFLQTIHNTQESINCLAYNNAFENVIFAASTKRLYKINLATNNTDYFEISKDKNRNPSNIWCMEFVKRFLCTGDSRGVVTIWNPDSFGVVKAFSTHKADIFTISVGANCLYASGVDPEIVKLEIQSNGDWIETSRFFGQIGDVRSLCLTDCQLLAGGMNCIVSRYDVRPGWTDRVPKPIPIDDVPTSHEIHRSPINKNCILFVENDRSIEIYDIHEKGLKESLIRTIKASEHDVHLQSWSASKSLEYIAYSTNHETRILRMKLTAVDNETRIDLKRFNGADFVENALKPEKGGSICLPPSSLLKFVEMDSRTFLVLVESFVPNTTSDNNSKILIYEFLKDSTMPILKTTILTREENFFNQVHRLQVSDHGRLLAFSTLDGMLFIYSLNKLRMIKKIVRQDSNSKNSNGNSSVSRIICMTFHPTNHNLVAIYSNRKIVDIDFQHRINTKWTNAFNTHARPEWINSSPMQIQFVDQKKILALIGKKMFLQINMEKPAIIPPNVPLFTKSNKVAVALKRKFIATEMKDLEKKARKMRKIINELTAKDQLDCTKVYEKRLDKYEKKIADRKSMEVQVDVDTCLTWNFYKQNMIGFKYSAEDHKLHSISLMEESQSNFTYRKKIFGL